MEDPEEMESLVFLDEDTRDTYIVPLSKGTEKTYE